MFGFDIKKKRKKRKNLKTKKNIKQQKIADFKSGKRIFY